jgi:hypothetical protein
MPIKPGDMGLPASVGSPAEFLGSMAADIEAELNRLLGPTTFRRCPRTTTRERRVIADGCS